MAATHAQAQRWASRSGDPVSRAVAVPTTHDKQRHAFVVSRAQLMPAATPAGCKQSLRGVLGMDGVLAEPTDDRSPALAKTSEMMSKV